MGHVQFGLTKGASDLIGFESVTITPEMVGHRVAVFTALEVKGPKGNVSPEQREFLKAVEDAGGIAAVVRSVEDALAALGNPPVIS
jgi:hypothetical protein